MLEILVLPKDQFGLKIENLIKFQNEFKGEFKGEFKEIFNKEKENSTEMQKSKNKVKKL